MLSKEKQMSYHPFHHLIFDSLERRRKCCVKKRPEETPQSNVHLFAQVILEIYFYFSIYIYIYITTYLRT